MSKYTTHIWGWFRKKRIGNVCQWIEKNYYYKIKIMFSLYHLQVDTFVLLQCLAVGIHVVMVDCVPFVGHVFAIIIITKFVPNLKFC